MTIIANVFTFPAVVLLAVWQLWLVTRNLTTNESENVGRYNHFWVSTVGVMDGSASRGEAWIWVPPCLCLWCWKCFLDWFLVQKVERISERWRHGQRFINPFDKGSLWLNCLDFWWTRRRAETKQDEALVL